MTLDIGLVAHHVERQDGQGRAMLELTRQLALRGHRITLYSQGRSAELDGAVTDRRVWHLGGPDPVTTSSFFAGATKAVRSARHDVTCVLGACALPRPPFVYYAQFSHAGWQATWASGAPALKYRAVSALGRAMERIVVPRSDLLLTCHRDVGRQLGVPENRTVTVPNGIDVDEFHPPTEKQRLSARRGWGLSPDAWVVGFAGEYNTTRKGLDVLVDAVASGPPDEHLLVAGSGDQQALQARARELGCHGRVHPVGFADIVEVLAAADVAVVPSRYEPFSIVALEACASHVPLVISSRAGAADHLRDAAQVVDDPESSLDVRRAIDAIRSDPPGAMLLADRAVAVTEQLRWERVASDAADAVESAARR